MNVFILTGISQGVASLAIPRIVESGRHRLVAVVTYQATPVNRWKAIRRRLGKIARIGVLGAVNGIRMRRWFLEEPAQLLRIEPLAEVAARFGVPLHVTAGLNTDETRALVRGLGADIGLSLGNGYIGKSVFTIPRFGMLNIHHEVLPRYRGAQSVLWQLHDGNATTGYTVHQIDASIDGGAILYQQELPIEIRPTLHETIAASCAKLYATSVDGLLETLDRYEELAAAAQPQGSGASYTTPSIRQFWRMRRNYRRLLEGTR